MKPRTIKAWLIVIIALAAIFYFWGLDRNDIVTDEASYMVRGMKMLDFNFGIDQPTPIQWVKEVPWWMRLSFHDHPPLFFILENWSLKIFGENPVGGRMPSLAAGLVSIFFIFLIAKELYSAEAGLITAALFAFTVNRVWISRVALQEATVIALMLVTSWVFLRSLKNKKMLAAVGALLGLAALAKYTALILAPIFLTILVIKCRDYIKSIYFLLSVFFFLVLISPVIVYNIGLYRTFGHFDFQISYIVGQKVAAWKSAPGKEAIGSLADRLRNYLPALVKTNSPAFLMLAALGLVTAVGQTLKRKGNWPAHTILFVFLFWSAPLMLAIGPTYRFLAMLTPWLAILAGVFLVFVGERIFYFSPNAAKLLFIILLIGEAAYSYNSVVALRPLGRTPWTFAAIRSENNNWGFNQLDEFLNSALRGKRPASPVSFDYPVLAKALEEAVANDAARGLTVAPEGIIFNGNISMGAQLWVFLRRVVAHGWPIADADTYVKALLDNGPDYFKKLGIKKIYFINNTGAVLLRVPQTRPLTSAGDILESRFIVQGVRPREIKNLRGEAAFHVYEFTP